MTVGVVLAGGRSRRFGRDKLVEPMPDGRPMLAWTIDAIRPVVDAIVVVGRTADALPAGLGDVLAIADEPDGDAADGGGPVVGLEGGLGATDDDRTLVVAGDMPFLATPVLKLLLAALDGPDRPDCARLAAGAADTTGGDQTAVLPVAVRSDPARAAVRSALGRGDRRLRSVLDALRTTVVPDAEWRPLDPAGRTLRDIDRPTDLAVTIRR